MSIKRLYKRIIPDTARNFVAGHPWVESWRNRQLVREGQELAATARAERKPDGKIRVAFIVQRPALWCNHASIYEAMQADLAFEVSVIAIPKRPPAAQEVDLAEYGRLQTFLQEKGIPFFGGYNESAQAWINPLTFGLPDIVFLPQPYSFTQSYMYGGDYLSQFVKIAYVTYGAVVSSIMTAQLYSSPFFKDCWRIFVESEGHRKLFIELNPHLSDNIIASGQPKADTYLAPAQCVGLWKLPMANKRIIWAPHFTVSRDKTPHTFSNFFEYYDFFLQYAVSHPNIEFVLRPHPELFEHMVATGLKTRTEAESYWNQFNALPNGQVYESGDIFELFKESDALILDSLGFLVEYLPTGKPICFLDSFRRQRLNVIGEALLASYYRAWNPQEVEQFIQEVVVDGQDRLKEKRLEARRTHLLLPKWGAGVEIAKHILKQMELKRQ